MFDPFNAAARRRSGHKVVRELRPAQGGQGSGDGAPPVKEKVTKAEAADMKKKLEEVGASVEVK